MPENETKTTQPAETDALQPDAPETPVNKPLPTSKIPDWKPLGTIRDYFTEQMKQDGFYGR